MKPRTWTLSEVPWVPEILIPMFPYIFWFKIYFLKSKVMMLECSFLLCKLVFGYTEAMNMDTVRGTMVTLDIDPHVSKKVNIP